MRLPRSSRILLLVALAALGLLTACVAVLMKGDPLRAKFDRLRPGMSREEVHAVMEADPPATLDTRPSSLNLDKSEEWWYVAAGKPADAPRPVIWVVYDADGRAVRSHLASPTGWRETIWLRVLRWLGV